MLAYGLIMLNVRELENKHVNLKLFKGMYMTSNM